ncbi:MAG TPA: hypothetical protein VNJ46_05475 [Gaiellaceae bacterium]|nr:hypothetical protein [Gaiellaceae bacterium]
MDVLRRLLRSLAPAGLVVDLLSVPPPEQVEIGGEVVGELDNDAFFARALPAAAGLDALADDGLLVLEHEERFPIYVHYPTGADLIEDVALREHTRMPRSVARRLRSHAGPCRIRDHCLVRRFRALP